MRVVEVRSFGGPEVLVAADAPAPVAGPGEVVVDVAAADVMFLDVRLRRVGPGILPDRTALRPRWGGRRCGRCRRR